MVEDRWTSTGKRVMKVLCAISEKMPRQACRSFLPFRTTRLQV